MKKLLLGSTALIGAAAFTAPALADATLEFSGNIEYRYNYTDNDLTTSGTNDDDSADFHNAGTDLVLTATYETDGGLEYGGVVDLNFDGDDHRDESYLFFKGDWGTVEIGDNDGAMSTMTYSGEKALSGTTGFDGGATKNVNTPDNFGAPTGPSTVGATGDDSKITYYTPDLSGFQLGVSYTPRVGGFDDGNLVANNSDIVSLAATYEGTFDSVTVGVNAGYRFGDVDANNTEDISAFEIGAMVSYAGFTLAGGYGDSGDSGETENSGTNLVNDDADWWNIGFGYSTGSGVGAWGVGIGYFNGDQDEYQNNSNGVRVQVEDEYEMFTVGGHYNFLEGLKTYAEINFMEYDLADATPTAAENNDSEATSFIIGSNLTF